MREQLKPCPFCGGEARAIKHQTYFSVICLRCGAQIRGPKSPRADLKRAVTAWNTRASWKRLRALVNKQAADEGLWFLESSAAEAYLQQELRKLHAVIEEMAKIERGE